jgi:hypothetical protein
MIKVFNGLSHVNQKKWNENSRCDRETEKWLLDGTEDHLGNEVIIQHKLKYIKTRASAKRYQNILFA